MILHEVVFVEGFELDILSCLKEIFEEFFVPHILFNIKWDYSCEISALSSFLSLSSVCYDWETLCEPVCSGWGIGQALHTLN
jgi:hypothetical protein